MIQIKVQSGHIGVSSLEKQKFTIWLYSVRAFGEANELLEHLDDDVYIPGSDDERRIGLPRSAQFGCLIIATLRSEVLMEADEEITVCTPYGMMQRI